MALQVVRTPDFKWLPGGHHFHISAVFSLLLDLEAQCWMMEIFIQLNTRRELQKYKHMSVNCLNWEVTSDRNLPSSHKMESCLDPFFSNFTPSYLSAQ